MTSELRKWMESKFGTLQENRDTESYALEFLKTTDANLKYHQQKTTVDIIVNNLSQQIEKLTVEIESLKKFSVGH